MRAHVLQFLRHPHVILERILLPRRVENIAGVAKGRLAYFTRPEHGFHRHSHIGRPIERVEDAEDVHAVRRGMLHESLHHIVRIVAVAHGIRAAEEHLETDVRDALAQGAEARPRVFVQEAQSGIERGATPHLQAVEVRQPVRHEIGDGHHVVGAHACGQQRLMSVAESCIGQQKPPLVPRPRGEFFGAHLVQQLPGTTRRL